MLKRIPEKDVRYSKNINRKILPLFQIKSYLTALFSHPKIEKELEC